MSPTNTMKTLEQYRAAHALQQLRNARGAADKAKSAPAMVQQNGLLQAVTFWQEKQEWWPVYQALQDWFLHNDMPLDLPDAGDDLRGILLAAEMPEYRALTAEALAYLGWLKRLAGAQR